MKFKTISRSADDYVPVANTQSARQPRNLDPDMHPFERAREYTRALNATKLDRMFAAPFLGQLGAGHVDGVYSLAKNPLKLGVLASGSGDGVVKTWDLGSHEEQWSVNAHDGIVRGLCYTPKSQLLSCSSDGTVKLWSPSTMSPLQTYHSLSGGGLMSIDHHYSEDQFITAGTQLEVWDTNRSKPKSTLSWGADNLSSVRFNHTETNICASTGNDRSIVVYDLRTNSPVQKLVTTLNNNALAWNPMEAFVFAAASEDHNAYLYDMRNMKRALNVFQDHVAAVLDLDFSPTGQELVTGSYDRTIRIFRANEGHSRDIYHTKRMQRVFSVRFTMDSRYIASGSDDGNVRMWRSVANDRSGIKSAKQRTKIEYDRALTERYKHMPEIRRINAARRVPKAVKVARNIKREELEAMKRRHLNYVKNSKGRAGFTPEREKHIVGVGIADKVAKQTQKQRRKEKKPQQETSE
ncbi:rRNA-processing protein [Starmerella bacillaris]|uniref:DDB1- and CUL4-associated factor 13 n=1 Tax=Starmerella bacillaris TaxID=1247836 RepID=A0AAV5RGG5_STABA|nr:rRNA-processing protein [Starmerella bacillaris]